MVRRERKIIRREVRIRRAFPSEPDERLACLLNVINTEPKQVTMLLTDDIPKSSWDLRRGFIKVTDGVWLIRDVSFSNYCHETFVPIGMVCEEHVLYDIGRAATCWSTNETGERFGKPMSSFCLKKATEYGKSMYEIFGFTASPGESRAPMNRFLVLEYLLRHGVSREADLIEFIRVDHEAVRRHLKQLEKAGIVNYDAVDPEEPGWAVYEWSQGNPQHAKTVRHQRRLTADVAQYVFEHDKGNCDEIAKKLYKQEEYKSWKIDSLKKAVSDVLSGLEEQGFLHSKYKGGKRHSEAMLTYEGRVIVTDLMQMRDFVEGRCSIDENAWQQYAHDAVVLYKNVHPHGKDMPFDEHCTQVLNIISESNGIRPKDVEREIDVRPMPYLRALVDNGLVVKERKGRAVFYRVV